MSTHTPSNHVVDHVGDVRDLPVAALSWRETTTQHPPTGLLFVSSVRNEERVFDVAHLWISGKDAVVKEKLSRFDDLQNFLEVLSTLARDGHVKKKDLQLPSIGETLDWDKLWMLGQTFSGRRAWQRVDRPYVARLVSKAAVFGSVVAEGEDESDDPPPRRRITWNGGCMVERNNLDSEEDFEEEERSRQGAPFIDWPGILADKPNVAGLTTAQQELAEEVGLKAAEAFSKAVGVDTFSPPAVAVMRTAVEEFVKLFPTLSLAT